MNFSPDNEQAWLEGSLSPLICPALQSKSIKWLDRLRQAAFRHQNLFEVLMEALKYCSLGQITNLFFEVGGQYRRNM